MAEQQEDFAYRFEYADGSAFEVTPDGRTFLTWPNGKREEKHGKITNRIPQLKPLPPQDALSKAMEAVEAAAAGDCEPAKRLMAQVEPWPDGMPAAQTKSASGFFPPHNSGERLPSGDAAGPEADTPSPAATANARQRAFNILSAHSECLRDDTVMDDLIEAIATALSSTELRRG